MCNSPTKAELWCALAFLLVVVPVVGALTTLATVALLSAWWHL